MKHTHRFQGPSLRLRLATAALLLATAHFASAQTTVIQPLTEADSKDAKIYNSTPAMNFSSNLNVTSPDTGAHFLSLVQFNLAPVPTGTVSSASLTLYSTGLGASGAAAIGGTISVRPITSGWSETTADAAVAGAPPLATYNAFFGTTPTITLGNVVATQAVNASGFFSWDLTSLVQQWRSGSLANNGVMFFLSTAGGDVGFADVDSNPEITGSAPKLTVSVVPEPSAVALLVGGGMGVLLVCRRAGTRAVRA